MSKLYAVFILISCLLIPKGGYSDDLHGIMKEKGNCSSIEDGSRCYTPKQQIVFDEALELGVVCQEELKQTKGALSACRKWRDKYKELLEKEKEHIFQITQSPQPILTEVEYQNKWTRSTWLKFGVATALAFGLGLGIGVAF